MTRATTAIVALPGRTVLTITGDLDPTSADLLCQTISVVVRWGQGRIEVDLSKVTSIDCTSVGALLAGRQHADQLAKTYQVAGACGPVRDALDAAGVLDYLTLGHRATTTPSQSHPGDQS